jgi:hypothetical protein
MPYPHKTLQFFKLFFVKYFVYQTHVFVMEQFPVPGNGYSAAFLPPVLERDKPVENIRGYVPLC